LHKCFDVRLNRDQHVQEFHCGHGLGLHRVKRLGFQLFGAVAVAVAASPCIGNGAVEGFEFNGSVSGNVFRRLRLDAVSAAGGQIFGVSLRWRMMELSSLTGGQGKV
jgi:hypothetical protein